MPTQEEKYRQAIEAAQVALEAKYGLRNNVDDPANNTTPRFQFNNGGGSVRPTLGYQDMGEGEEGQYRVGLHGDRGDLSGYANVGINPETGPQTVYAGGSLGPARVDATIPIQAPDWFNLDATMTLDQKKQLAIFFNLTPMERAVFLGIEANF